MVRQSEIRKAKKPGQQSRFAGNTKKFKKEKPKRGHTQRFLKAREPQLVEDAKSALFIRGPKTSESIQNILKDFRLMKSPYCKFLGKRNQMYSFEDETSVEFLCQKNDCSLFCVGSHTKKRPNNLCIGRMFGHPEFHVLDMIELGVSNYRGIAQCKAERDPNAPAIKSKAVGAKPCMIFQGSEWEHDQKCKKLQNLLLDFFTGVQVDRIALAGLDHVIVCSATMTSTAGGEAIPKIFFRTYNITFKKSGTRVPKVELEEVGPSMDFVFRRTNFASEELYGSACKKPKQLAKKKTKNVTKNELGDKVGRIHMEKQDFEKMQIRKTKALRDTKDSRITGNSDENSGGTANKKRKAGDME